MNMIDTLPAIDELQRIPSPAPAPQALACDGHQLWMGSLATHRIYGIDAHTGRVFEEGIAPGRPIGAVVTGDALRVVTGETDDDRCIRRYIFGHGFKTSERVSCPEATGSFLGYDGEWLYLSQWYNNRILQIDSAGGIHKVIAVGAQISGFVFIDGMIYLARGEEDVEWRIARINPHVADPVAEDLATVPFELRSLAYDGSRFWTNHRSENQIVAFALPETGRSM